MLLTFVLLEGQSGSPGPLVPPLFNQVREIGNATSPRASMPHQTSLRVMTWNIHHGSDPARIAAAIEANPADLCLLQEVDFDTARTREKDVARELAGRLRLHGAFGIEFEELSQEVDEPAYSGQVNLSNLAVRGSRVLRFERQSRFWRPRRWLPSGVPLMQRRLGSRIALVTEFEFGGRLLVVYNAHLESRSAGAIQERQIEEMLEDAKQYGPDVQLILGGDLNTKYFPSKFLRKLERAGFRSVLGEKIERTHRIAMALDWIFVKTPLEIEGGEVRRDVGGSDHFPVYGRVTAR